MQKNLGWLVVVCFSVFAILSLIVHGITGYDPIRASLSTYATGPRGWIEETGFFLSLIGQVSLTIGLFMALPHTKPILAGIISYCVSSIGVLLVVLFPSSTFVDRPTDGLHWLGAFMTFAAFPLMALLISLAIRSIPEWQTTAPIAILFVSLNITIVVLFAIMYFASLPGKFVAEKVDVIFTTAWQITMGYQLAKHSLASNKPLASASVH